jgi:starvation-inducible DNA-binding protein
MNSTQQKTSQKLLNQILANESVLLMQTLNYHWNLVGPEFHDYHLLFDKHYHALFEHMDDIAERVRAIQGIALGSFKHILEHATLKEDLTVPTPKQMIAKLVKQYEIHIEHIRASIATIEEKTQDFGSINFLEDLLMKHEKTTWMLRSLL